MCEPSLFFFLSLNVNWKQLLNNKEYNAFNPDLIKAFIFYLKQFFTKSWTSERFYNTTANKSNSSTIIFYELLVHYIIMWKSWSLCNYSFISFIQSWFDFILNAQSNLLFISIVLYVFTCIFWRNLINVLNKLLWSYLCHNKKHYTNIRILLKLSDVTGTK